MELIVMRDFKEKVTEILLIKIIQLNKEIDELRQESGIIDLSKEGEIEREKLYDELKSKLDTIKTLKNLIGEIHRL